MFCRGYAVIAEQLTRLTRKNVKYVFAEEQRHAFLTSKRLLTELPVLERFHPAAWMHLYTDVCAAGLEAVLTQKHLDGKVGTVACFSRQMTEVQRWLYYAIELECYAVVAALKQFRHFLSDKEFDL